MRINKLNTIIGIGIFTFTFLLVVGVKLLGYNHIQSIADTDVGNILTLTYGVSGGILALVGLISVFVSINSQHLIQKLRELLWTLIAIPNKYSNYRDGKALKEFEQTFWLYERIYTRQDFIRSITVIMVMTIMVAAILWIFACLVVVTHLQGHTATYLTVAATVSGAFILVCFMWLLLRLSNYRKVGQLPEPKDLLDADHTGEDSGVSSLYIAAMTTQVQYWRKLDGTYMQIEIQLGFPFKNVIPTVANLSGRSGVIEAPYVLVNSKMKWQYPSSPITNDSSAPSHSFFHSWIIQTTPQANDIQKVTQLWMKYSSNQGEVKVLYILNNDNDLVSRDDDYAELYWVLPARVEGIIQMSSSLLNPFTPSVGSER